MTNDQIIQEFRKSFDHTKFCKEFPENEPKNCRCDYSEFQDFLLSALEQKDTEKERALEEQKERIKNALFYGAAKRGFEKSDVENEQGWILSILKLIN